MVKVEINLDRVYSKLSQSNINRGRRALANQAMADMNQFVPAQEFILRNSVTLGLDGQTINYNTPYARKMFYVQFVNYTLAGTGPRWDLKAKGMFISDWNNAFIKGAGL